MRAVYSPTIMRAEPTHAVSRALRPRCQSSKVVGCRGPCKLVFCNRHLNLQRLQRFLYSKAFPATCIRTSSVFKNKLWQLPHWYGMTSLTVMDSPNGYRVILV
jgi:hypothetical protein